MILMGRMHHESPREGSSRCEARTADSREGDPRRCRHPIAMSALFQIRFWPPHGFVKMGMLGRLAGACVPDYRRPMRDRLETID